MPGFLFDVLCVVHTTADILARAAAIQARQTSIVLRKFQASSSNKPTSQQHGGSSVNVEAKNTSRHRDHVSWAKGDVDGRGAVEYRIEYAPRDTSPESPLHSVRISADPGSGNERVTTHVLEVITPTGASSHSALPPPSLLTNFGPSRTGSTITPQKPDVFLDNPFVPPEPSFNSPPRESAPIGSELEFGVAGTASPIGLGTADTPLSTALPLDHGENLSPPPILKSSRVPSSRIGRLFHYGSLAAGLGAGAATEYIRRATGNSSETSGSLLMSEANVGRLVDKLSRMRGAALKLGQFMSIQDSNVLPEQIENVLRQVQNSAHYMPNWQMEQVIAEELGPEWRSLFSDFEPIPFASASIGQVHLASSAVIPSKRIALKIQFPSVAESITSDLRNISLLLHTSRLLPRGLYLGNTLTALEEELKEECDYVREAENARRFRRLLDGDERFEVPRVIEEVSRKRVLGLEWMDGVPVGKGIGSWDQNTRNEIATNILSLCLKELFQFRFMQTDPNWTNFLYNASTHKIQLVDFGASREYSKSFMDNWYGLLHAAIEKDREDCIDYSRKLGYLTGEENELMVDAHVQSLFLLGHPFSPSTAQPFSFATSTIPEQIRSYIPTMLQHRLTPPPRETYSLNRKLSGAFLLCGKLQAVVSCRDVWEKEVGGYQVG